MTSRQLSRACVLSLLLSVSRLTAAQQAVASPADVRTIGDIVRASYETVSGAAGKPRQWRRDSTLYAPHATYVATEEAKGKVVVMTMTGEEYRRRNDSAFVARGLFEAEIGRHIERYGNVAEVRSISIFRRTAKGAIEGRSVNYYQLYRDGTRWWIAGIVWDIERASAPIPQAWIGRLDGDVR